MYYNHSHDPYLEVVSCSLKLRTRLAVVTSKGGWRGLHSKELQNIHTLRNISRITKSRKMKWTGHISRIRAIFLYLWGASCCVILYVYLSNIPAIATEIFVVILFCPFTTCFGPYGPSSGEIHQHLYIFWKCHPYHNGSVVLQLFTHVV
jgi:hypothetical protein